MKLFGLGHLGGGDVLNLRSTVAVLKDQHLHHDQVDDGVEVLTGVDGILDRRDLVAEIFFQFADGVVEVGVAVVELVHEEHNRLVGVGSVTPGVFGGGFNTRLGVDGADGHVGSVEAADDVAREVAETRGVQDVDLLVVVDGVHHGSVHRNLTFHFDGTIVGDGVLLVGATFSVDELAFEKHVFGKRGLTRLCCADEGNIADVFCLEFLHFYLTS